MVLLFIDIEFHDIQNAEINSFGRLTRYPRKYNLQSYGWLDIL